MSREGWHLAMDISVYSLVAVCRAAAPLMTDGGAIVTISYFGGEKVMPGYNVMGVCKAALEHSVRYLAWDLGRQEDSRQLHQRRPDADAQSPRASPVSTRCANTPPKSRRWAATSSRRNSARPASICSSDLSGGVTGETIHVDCGYSIVGL